MHYIFAFRSRNQSMRFYEMLRRENVFSKIISTPRAISVGCGLSVQVGSSAIENAKKIFHGTNFDTFLGLFLIDSYGCKRIGV